MRDAHVVAERVGRMRHVVHPFSRLAPILLWISTMHANPSTLRTRCCALGLILAAVSAFTITARAEDVRVVVRPFSGLAADRLRTAVVRDLIHRKGVSVVPTSLADETAEHMRVDPHSPGGRMDVARELHISAWLEGVVTRLDDDRLKVSIVVYDGNEHERIGRASVARRRSKALGGALHKVFWRRLGPVIMSARPPDSGLTGDKRPVAMERLERPGEELNARVTAPDAPAGVESSGASANLAPVRTVGASESPGVRNDDAPEPSSEAPETPIFTARFGVQSMSRRLQYNDSVTQNLGSYRLAAAPALTGSLRIVPGARSDSAASWFGIRGHARGAFGIRTQSSSGAEFGARSDDYSAGIDMRVPIHTHGVGVLASYGIQRYQFSDVGEELNVPQVDYRFAEFGAQADVGVGRFGFELSGSYRLLQAAGELTSEDWFPRTSGGGVAAEARLSIDLIRKLQLFTELTMQRYFFDFSPEPGDRRVAGGATDDYLAAGLGLRATL